MAHVDCLLPARGLTPYQGTRRCFGEFECDCGNTWSSGNSWRDTFQNCRQCKAKVYPHVQKKLEGGNDDGPPHDQQKCGMCRRIGYNCRQLSTRNEDCNYNCECGRSWFSRRTGPLVCRGCDRYVDDDDEEDEEDEEGGSEDEDGSGYDDDDGSGYNDYY